MIFLFILIGVVIIIGEIVRKFNVNEVLNVFSGMVGDFVVVIVGLDLESIIVGKGLGVMSFFEKRNIVIFNLDIGGGIINIFYFDKGKVLDIICLDIGGRFIKFNRLIMMVEYISDKFIKFIVNLGLNIKVGVKVEKFEIVKLCKEIVDILL